MKTIGFIVLSLAIGAGAAEACDLCSIYASLGAKESATGWFGGAYEQLTHFGTLRDEGKKVANPAGQKLDSSITQIFVGYQFSSDLGVQLNLPLVRRSFRRAAGGGVERGSENGLGDAAVLAHWRPLLAIHGDTLFTLTLLGGVKLPTGSSDRIREELVEGDASDGAIASGIHGHDLALGSGSVDTLVGTSAFLRYRRGFVTANVQYALRNRGDFHYRYADDLAWSVSPGVYLDLTHENTVSIGAVVSGEHKGLDDLAGTAAEDTGMDAIYVGPQLTYSRSINVYAEVAADVPVRQHNSALQSVPDYRVRFAVTWRP